MPRMPGDARLKWLERASRIEFTGGFPNEPFLVHRRAPEQMCPARRELDDAPSGDGEDFHYVRVMQANGRLGWRSPVWAGAWHNGRRGAEDPERRQANEKRGRLRRWHTPIAKTPVAASRSMCSTLPSRIDGCSLRPLRLCGGR